MNGWAEGALALAVTLVFGAGLWLFTGEPVGDETTDTTIPLVVDTEAAARGQTLASDTGCLACHTVDGAASTGPTWKGRGRSHPTPGLGRAGGRRQCLSVQLDRRPARRRW